ncbi:MAG: 4-alpha-glucanotransferase [Candidatus Eisenbacteria bacterium]|uniref:4-alpha-glucanotransferase n=1 Tax=Eiseniibacteriota bacterium TaxID=2212470 RepID=A0A538THP1_UNCEI|nr:MAG: 4-alpha-glucanotransferase [Candidatus Eisenbacteria bacterium]
MVRNAGLLLHPTSLPGPYGIGDIGPRAIRFLDWAASAGLSVWQVLPLGPTGLGNSPYSALSVFAGSPLLISPEWLVEEGLLDAEALEEVPEFLEGPVDYERARMWKERMLRAAWENVRRGGDAGSRAAREDLKGFLESPGNAAWLADWTLYAAVKDRQEGGPWTEWYKPVAGRKPAALEAAERTVTVEREYHAFVQWIFARQWKRLREAARERGIEILGDMPIYPALDSAEVWANQRLFTLGEDGMPEDVAGVPPDYFSETGQLWGNPLYRWDRMEAEGFKWWVVRVRAALAMFDRVRIDHFRAFASYWAIPAAAQTAMEGRWVRGPGMKLFEALRRELGELKLVAEDLGIIDEPVRDLLRASGFPGMRVLQFGLTDPRSTHHPRNHVENAIVYTGTHDNDTSRGWFEGLDESERAQVLGTVGGDGREIEWDMIRVALDSPARTAIIPMQDVLGLGSEARMNMPSEPDGNWEWRMAEGALTTERAARMRGLAEGAGRAFSVT